MARPKRALGELGKVTYTVEPNGLVIARARVYDGNGQERRPSGSGASATKRCRYGPPFRHCKALLRACLKRW